jgi:proteasome lid subunit RPN8/RPN11
VRTCPTSAAGWSAAAGGRRALKAIEDGGNELLAIYHSHTKSAAYPSQTDVNQAVNWPDAIYLIVSLQDADVPDVKGYWLKDLTIADAELVVE